MSKKISINTPSSAILKTIDFIDIGATDYLETLNKMKAIVSDRENKHKDQVWLTQHPPVYTVGASGKKLVEKHIHSNFEKIPLIVSDRGGKITYHGPGQLVAYTLIDIKRSKITIRKLVSMLEETVIKLLKQYKIDSCSKKEAPGVYCEEKKIASIGLKIQNGITYHGLSINVDMDLRPFNQISPCGYDGLLMTQIKDFCKEVDFDIAKEQFKKQFLEVFTTYE